VKITKHTFQVLLLVIVVLTLGCAKPKPEPDPLASWKFKPFPGWELPPYGHNTNHLDQAIVDDYQDFIKKNNLDTMGAITGFYEDGTGQHAVEFEAFEVGPNAKESGINTSWHYVLIYNTNNQRIKLIKYDHLRYQS